MRERRCEESGVHMLSLNLNTWCQCHWHWRVGIVCGSFRRRSGSRRRQKKVCIPSRTSSSSSSSSRKLEAVIDLSPLTALEAEVRRLVCYGRDAYRDLQSLVTVDENHRVVVSCRPSTLQFLGTTFLAFSVISVLLSRFSSLRRNSSGYYKPVVVRRDRSLGGKEVVVASSQFRHTNSLSPPPSLKLSSSINNNKILRFQRKLPKWWPSLINSNSSSLFDPIQHDEYRRAAYRVVRAITNSRLGGNDIMDDHIIQLRQLCRTSGVQVSIEPTNIRDTLYRASVNFVLNVCGRLPTYSTSVDINGEDAPEFLAGFAENIDLENVRAATIVSAAVAARTRSCLLQAWALEMQSKHVDAMVELSKICLLLRIFPPEESSPEMEMVSRGLEKHLKLEQREHLMFLFGKVCGEGSHRIAREALGLTHSQNGCSDQLEDNIAP